MNDPITQTRLSTRLDTYLREYTGKQVTDDAHFKAEWETVWHLADVARTNNTLTPELVDDVRQALKKLGTARGTPVVYLLPEVQRGGV
ncbi:MAG: hypothetical protein NVSMB38_40040 [Ktedonobacteraceae bacterium]